MSLPARFCCPTSENAEQAKFAERPQGELSRSSFHQHRRCRSGLHTSQGRKRKVRIFEPSRAIDTPLTIPLKNPRFLYQT
jgi:hypothetical protein